MEKPEFTKLMKEYMDDISNPKHREEQEMYLRQLEAEQKLPGDVQLIHPLPGFCIKYKLNDYNTVTSSSKSSTDEKTQRLTQKLFINVCQAKEVEIAEKEATVEQGVKGAEWHVPYSVGPLRYESDKSGMSQMTFDVAVNPETFNLALKHKQFKDMMIGIVSESVEARMKELIKVNVKLDPKQARTLRGVSCIGGKPAIMQLRHNQTQKQETKATRSNKQSSTAKKTNNEAKRKDNTPKYTITHRGQIDIADFCMKYPGAAAPSKRPKELIIRIILPGLKSSKRKLKFSFQNHGT